MNFPALLLISIFAHSSAQQTQTCSLHGFTLKLQNGCSLHALRESYEKYLAEPENQILAQSDCGADHIDNLLDGQDVDSLCQNAIEINGEITFDEIVRQGQDSKFIESFYRGNTYWNEEVETNYDLDDPNGSPTNVLKEDIAQVPLYYELAEQTKVKYPSEIDNFDLDSCGLNTVMCCWSLDRQKDNDGNCATPYDTNCVDKDPADNTDICGVHLDRGNASNNLNTDGFTVLEGDNDDGEGATHCHGFAFSNNANDAETRYMGNNLFFISMYDHLYKRGYARNIPGAPMCGCVEQMPVVTRSDCTQVDVTETFTFLYDPLNGFSVTASDVNIDFNACQGLNDNNNDLSAYVARLETEGKVTLAQKNQLASHLVEADNCPTTIERNLALKGFVRGFNENTYEHMYSFPSTDTHEIAHGLCVLGASSAGAFSDTDFELEYKVVSDFRDGTRLWSDKDYVVKGIQGADMCEGGIYLEPTKYKSIDRYTDITVGANSITGDYISICVILSTDYRRTGNWNKILPNEGFKVSDEFAFTRPNGRNVGKMRSYCKTSPEPPTAAPSSVPTGTLKDYGSTPPTSELPLGLCSGDCDSSDICGPGLMCFQRDGLAPVPGCVGDGKSDYDYCIDPRSLDPNDLRDYGGNPSKTELPLGLCSGDCDNSDHCAPGLMCFQREGNTPVPGCVGDGVKDYDYCIDPQNLNPNDLRDYGGNPSSIDLPLGLCSGDCDDSDHCDEGLVCFQREGNTPVPGCVGDGVKDYDYCIDPRSLEPNDLRDYGVDPSIFDSPLGLCSGDCDTNDDCGPGLMCFQREGNTPVPGCVGDGVKDYDYCIDPQNLGPNELRDYGANPSVPLGLCSGDCDTSDDCDEDLVCFQRGGLTPVPGCVGDGVKDYDYCIDPQSLS